MKIVPGYLQEVDATSFSAFCAQIRTCAADLSTMDCFRSEQFRDQYSQLAHSLLRGAIESAKRALGEPHLGIAVLDIPHLSEQSEDESRMFGLLCAAALFSSLARPRLVPPNGVPFGLHLARSTRRENADGSIPTRYTPDVEVGYHTDGITTPEHLYVPHAIGVYNLLLGFDQPGVFHWLPYANWPERDRFTRVAELKRPSLIRIPPAAYLGRDNKEVVGGARFVQTPIVRSRFDGNTTSTFFLNGDLIGNDEDARVTAERLLEMRASLEATSGSFKVAQKERRLIVVRNSCGFHARDQLRGPQEGCEITRAFVRFIDSEGITFAPLQSWESSPVAEH